MNYIYTILFYITIFKIVLLECGKGCLKCDTSKKCQICDINLKMILEDGNCKEQ